jgi:hypothetical protein
MFSLLLMLATPAGPVVQSHGPYPTMAKCMAAAEQAIKAAALEHTVLRAECAKE